jgi:hypothetical protein
MIDALLRKDRWRYWLLIALAIVGLEIDVFSNPYIPEFVLCRLYSVLDESSAGPICPRDVAEIAGAASAAITLGSESALTTDETVAILPQKPAKCRAVEVCFADAYVRVNASLPSLAIARVDSPAHYSSLSHLLQLQLCRFLC